MENKKPARKSNIIMSAVVILGILLLTALIVMLLFINKSSKLNEENGALSDNLVMVEEQLNKQIEENNINRNEISHLKDSIVVLNNGYEMTLANKDYQITILKKQSNSRVAELEQQIEVLKEVEDEHEQLQIRYDKLLAETLRKRDDIRTLKQQMSDLQDTVEMSKKLSAYNISTLTKWNRWLFADRYNVETAKRVNEIHISMEIAGTPFTMPGKRDIFLNLLDPEGNLMYPQGEDFQYTKKQEIDYDGGYIPVDFLIENPSKLNPGDYTLLIYIGSDLVREHMLTLE